MFRIQAGFITLFMRLELGTGLKTVSETEVDTLNTRAIEQ